jgi:hypothetical protein
MFIQHILHGFLIVLIVFFGLPALFSLAISTMSAGRASSSLSLRFISKGLHSLLHGLSLLSEAIATGIVEQFPEKEAWLKPLLQRSFTTLFVLGSFYLVSILTSR